MIETLRRESWRVRDPDELLGGVTYALAVVLTVYTMYYAYERPVSGTRHTNFFLGIGFALYYLMVARTYVRGDADAPAWTDARGVDRARAAIARVDPFLCVALAALALGASAYVELNFVRLERDAFIVGRTTTDMYVGAAIVALSVDATRRAYGWVIAGVVIASIAYAFGGPYLAYVPLMPDMFVHSGMSFDQVTRFGGINLETGVFSFIMNVGATWVAIFIMFAGIAKVYGALDFILDVGREFGKKLRTGIVQVAVVASMAMGSITGSAAANTATTGSFTIPMMQDQGVRDDFATAIESVASSGGQIMPPVMGVAAFLMADFLDVHYLRIMQAGLIPALLFYFSVGIAVHLVVLRWGWTSDRSGSFDARVLLRGLVYMPAFAVLVVTLVAFRLSPLRAGLYTIVTIVLTMYLKMVLFDVARGSNADGVGAALLARTASTTRRTFDGFAQGAKDMAPLVSILASMGVIVALVNQTGLANNISRGMIDLGGGVLLLVLVLAMITSILFGLGMPTPAAYVLVVTLIAPALILLGVTNIVAHFFVFYFAMLSAITPPVAVAVAVGARISGAGFMAASKQALRIGAAGFVIPFAFVTNPSLIVWSAPDTPISLALVLVGVLALTVATTGFDGQRSLTLPHRLGYLAAAGLALFAPALSGWVGAGPALGLQVVAASVVLGSLLLSRLRGSHVARPARGA